MLALLREVVTFGVTILAGYQAWGIGFMILWCFLLSLQVLWVSNFRRDMMLWARGHKPNNLRNWPVALLIGVGGAMVPLIIMLVPLYLIVAWITDRWF